MVIDKNLFNKIESEVNAFNKATGDYHDVEVGDVIYSFLFSTEDQLHVMNDWDEGEANDPYWDKINNRHSTDSFFIYMNQLLKENGSTKGE